MASDEFTIRQAGTNETTSYALPDPVWWRNAFGTWRDTGRPGCMLPLTHGQHITIGVVNVAPAGGTPGGPVISWLKCAAKPVQRHPIVSPSATP